MLSCKKPFCLAHSSSPPLAPVVLNTGYVLMFPEILSKNQQLVHLCAYICVCIYTLAHEHFQ